MNKIIKTVITLTGLFTVSLMLSGLSITFEELRMILALLSLAILFIVLPMKEIKVDELKKGQITLGFYISGYILTTIYVANAFSASQILVNVIFAARPMLYSYLFSRIVTLILDQHKPKTETSYNFTNKELEVIEDLKRGLNNKEIAELHFIAESTVKRHIHNILKKTECKNRIELLELLKK